MVLKAKPVPHWHGNGYESDIMNIFKSCFRGGEYILPIHPVKLFNSCNIFLHIAPPKMTLNQTGQIGRHKEGPPIDYMDFRIPKL
jgi:hypothetical protein